VRDPGIVDASSVGHWQGKDSHSLGSMSLLVVYIGRMLVLDNRVARWMG